MRWASEEEVEDGKVVGAGSLGVKEVVGRERGGVEGAVVGGEAAKGLGIL